ncbi:MAG: metal ABC transporter substrate-binding protein [Verrucomicrobiota bacterium]
MITSVRSATCKVTNLAKCLGLAVTLALAATSAAQAKLNVVATLPDYGAIAQAIGGDLVKVTSLARGTEDPHYVDAKPSFVRVLNQADVLIDGGAELEIGWLPPLLEGARNKKILTGGSGRINAAEGIHLLEVPTGKIDRSQGDVHGAGNPHYSLDPLNGKIIARHIADFFAKLDGANAAAYQANLKKFNDRIDAKMAGWTKTLAPFKGTMVVTYHKNFEYFAERFGLVIAGQIEPKPGIEPSPTHIAALIPKMKEAGVKLVLIEPNRSRRTPDYVAEAIGAKVVVLPVLVEGAPEAKDFISLFDYLVREVATALK